MQIGKAEQMAGPFPRLYILEGDIESFPPIAIWMTDIRQHLTGRRPDVELVRVTADITHQPPRLFERARAGGKARHRIAEDLFTGIAEPVHRLGAYQQRLGRIDAAGDANDDSAQAGCAQAR